MKYIGYQKRVSRGVGWTTPRYMEERGKGFLKMHRICTIRGFFEERWDVLYENERIRKYFEKDTK